MSFLEARQIGAEHDLIVPIGHVDRGRPLARLTPHAGREPILELPLRLRYPLSSHGPYSLVGAPEALATPVAEVPGALAFRSLE